MSSASFFRQRRRALVLGTLVVLLHWMALRLIDANMGVPRQFAGEGGPDAMLAQLLPAPKPAGAPPAPVPLPVPKLAPPPLPRIAPLPAELGIPAQEAGGATTEAPPALQEAAPPVPAQPPAPLQQAAAQAPPAPAAEPPPAPGPAPAPELPRYTVDMPPAADILLDVARVDADGTRWSGEALLSWQLGQDAYRIRIEAGIKVVFARVNLVVLTSEGRLGAAGFAPVKMTEKRRGRALTATHFDWDGNKISFSASEASYPLAPGAQDKASVPLQLAAIARGDPAQLKGDIDILVGEDRDASVFRFQVVGQEEIVTRLGRLQTLHLTRPPKPGSYKSRLDVWLAPAHGWVPVQIRNTEANGAVTTQTVNNIVLNRPGT
ncbi:DUF3108 domain-containing protein [Massilia sp. ST3]|uniref:DUF3108 domain-containing protein n=1 Tax=Massilia sp. ST3 TaxID=2824903 RepID=UPI001B816F62|nr:DUF3108 domain-containing protein [Massilia sp. ST3]MBQ5948209.1 DUF3108 domain-containing protein [Massilia sp. ST3]